MICKTPKYIFASTSTLNLFFGCGQATLWCNEWDATISKILQAMPQSKNIMRQIQILALLKKEKYKRKRSGRPKQTTGSTGRWQIAVSANLPKFLLSTPLSLNVQAQPYRRGNARGKAFMGGGWAMACPKPPKAII